MGLFNFVLICSICILSNSNGVKSFEDESILEKVIRADEGEGTGNKIQGKNFLTLIFIIHKRRIISQSQLSNLLSVYRIF